MVQKRAKARRPVFGARKQKDFLAALAMTSNVAASARAVKVQESTIYKLRQRNPAFRRAWATALAEGYARLELSMLERAINGLAGVEEPAAGRVSDRMAMALLTLHAKSVADERARAAAEAKAGDEVAVGDDPVAALLGKLDEMAERMREA
ncbi:hypothetical protein [Sphingomonas quercus]|uniref:Uncharacterized protein n=1 Tax=Sphingomonas quercus TaxID=2842451 RepID=A0ABS6BJK2_9SPHN|nr:hypothetical protein [Sphingomonas quercus]MBU3078481.1 hypothetical protein [Sphingomonas quercus]